MTKKSRKAIIFVLMLILIGLYFISGTYARYTSEITGNVAVSTANWVVAFKQGTTELSNNFDLAFTVENNSNVVSGKIAPSVTAKATINVDLTGTEVAVDYTASIDTDALADAFGDSADNVTITVNGQDSATGTVKLANDAAFTADNGIVPIEIAITWENTSSTDVADTAAAGQDLVLPVTLTVEQHI